MTYPMRIEALPALSVGGTSPGYLSDRQSRFLRSMSKEEIEPILQTWLFFGLLHEILGNLYRPEDFIRDTNDADGHRKVLTTSTLVGLLDQWVVQIQSKTIERPSYDHIAECLRLCWAVLYAVPEDFSEAMKLSLASIGEVIEIAVNYKVFEIEDDYRENRCPYGWHHLYDKLPWKENLLASGWCPSQVDKLLETGNLKLQALFFLRGFSQSSDSRTHQRCAKDRCLAYQVDLDEYQLQHTKQKCDCGGELSIDPSLLHDVLLKSPKSLPLLRINGSSETDKLLSIEIVPSEENTKYVALSHVWADGLGNARRNALARCQIFRLSKLVKALNVAENQSTQELLLWCDTLCCPTQPDDAKNLALSRMTRTYEKAVFVLVLTSALLIHNSESLSYEEMWTMMMISPWMHRVWTLQEAVLGASDRRLWFQFKNKAVRSRTITRGIYARCEPTVGRVGIMQFLLIGMRKIFFRDSMECHERGVGLSEVDIALQGRSISYAFDEPLVIGTLLGLDIDKILNGPKESRIHRMWSLMPSAPQGIPIDVIFRACPKIEELGFRWAPATLLTGATGTRAMPFKQGIGQGYPTSKGLLVRLAGHRITMPQQRKGSSWNPWNAPEPPSLCNELSVRSEDGSWYSLHRKFPVESDSFLSNKSLRVLLQYGLELQGREMWIARLKSFNSPDGMHDVVPGLLLTVVEGTHGIKYARRELITAIVPWATPIQNLLELGFKIAQQLSRNPVGQRIAEFEEDSAYIESGAWKAASEALQSEVLKIVGSEEIAEKVVEAGHDREERGPFSMLYRYMLDNFNGGYGSLTDVVSEEQQWCID